MRRAAILVTVAFIVFILLAAEAAVRIRQTLKYGSTESIEDYWTIEPKSGLRVPIANFSVGHIAIISLGFVVAKFSLWLRELAVQLAPHIQTAHTGASMPIGVTMMALGGALAVLAAWRYHVVNRAIEHGNVSADRGLVILVTVMVALLCAAMIVYMLLTAQHA